MAGLAYLCILKLNASKLQINIVSGLHHPNLRTEGRDRKW